MKSFILNALLAAMLLFTAMASARAAEAAFGPEPPPEPGTAPVLGPGDIPVQIARARVGDWASYTDADGDILVLTVVERWTEHNDDHLVIRSTQKKGKKGKRKRETQSEEQVSVKDRIADARDLGPYDFLGLSDILVKGRPLSCVVVNYHEGSDLKRQSFLSDQVPVYGLVRGVLIEGNTRTTVLKLEDFGFAEED